MTCPNCKKAEARCGELREALEGMMKWMDGYDAYIGGQTRNEAVQAVRKCREVISLPDSKALDRVRASVWWAAAGILDGPSFKYRIDEYKKMFESKAKALEGKGDK